MNKKGLEDSMYTWIGVFFLLGFFVLIYFGGLFIMFADKVIFGDGEVVVEKGNNLIVAESFIDFLEGEEDGILVKNLVDSEDGLEIFREKGEEFVEGLNSKKVWLRVYDEEKVEVEISRSVIVREGRGSWSPSANTKKEVLCNPENSDGFLFFGFSLNKKIALCWENE